MQDIQAIILGIIQGVTEFLPISSTGHLYIGRHMFGLDEAGLLLDTMLHMGTLVAVFVFYQKEWMQMIRHPFSKLSFLLVVGTIPAIFVGFLFKDFFDEISKTGLTIGWEFLITGLFLYFADAIRKGQKKMQDITYTDAFVIGSFQAAAIFPAISRSGLTIFGGLIRGLDKETTAYFSFLLSTPAILGGVILQVKDLFFNDGSIQVGISPFSLLLGCISAAIFGYFAIRWMVSFLQKGALRSFSIYLWILGVFILAMQWAGKW